MSFIISAFREDQKFSIPRNEFVENLTKRWEISGFREITENRWTYLFEWVIQFSDGDLDAAFPKSLDHLSLDGDIKHCAEVALWFRTMVPNEIDLLFYNIEYTFDIEITMNTTIDEICQAYFGGYYHDSDENL